MTGRKTERRDELNRYGQPKELYLLPSSPAKMPKPSDQHYTSREAASSRESKRRVGWGPTNAQQPPFRTSSLSTPSNPYGRMEYELKDDEYARFNEEFKRDRAEMTGSFSESMAAAERALALRRRFERQE